MHAGFVLLFRNVTLSFSPPEAKNLSLTILVRGPGKGEIIQNEAAWPTPGRIEPPFPAQEALTRMSGDAQEWMRVGVPGAPYFTVKETLVPQLDIAALADMAYSEPQDAFAQAPPESKAMPITEFALGPAFPTIFDE
jgi:hypothetical protein